MASERTTRDWMMDQNARMQDRTVEKGKALDAVALLLDRIEGEGREPTTWERICVLSAVNNIFAGLYEMVEVDVEEATNTPPASAWGSTEIYVHFDLQRLKTELRRAEGAFIAEYPRFGGVEIPQMDRG